MLPPYTFSETIAHDLHNYHDNVSHDRDLHHMQPNTLCEADAQPMNLSAVSAATGTIGWCINIHESHLQADHQPKALPIMMLIITITLRHRRRDFDNSRKSPTADFKHITSALAP